MTAFSDDIDLIHNFQVGNENALKEIHVLYYRSLCYFAAKITGSLEEGEDIATEGFLKVWEKRKEFNALTHLRSFLFTAVRNASLNYVRHQKVVERAYQDIGYLNTKDENSNFNEEVEAEILRILYTEIESLPTQCKLIFNLLNFKGMSTSQVAEKLGISPQTVRNQKTKAIQLLKTAVLKRNLSIEMMIACMSILTM